MKNSFNTKTSLDAAGKAYEIFSLKVLEQQHDISHLPFSLKILLENLLRLEDGVNISREDIEALAQWNPQATERREIAFTPARVLLQDLTGVPAVVDLAAMREAMLDLGGDPDQINPLSPVDLVIDHSVQVDAFRSDQAFDLNVQLEFQRNRERYAFLRWGQNAFSNFRVVPPDTGIVHQINLEYLAQVVFCREADGVHYAYPDTLVGTDSHTTMINALGILGWGVGGIEAEAGMLGQPISMLIPQVVGFRLKGQLAEGTTATDLVLMVTQVLRNHGVVGKFVEFFGEGLDHLPLADRATIANMAPEYGATCGIFPIDYETLRYLELTGRTPEQIALVEAYARTQGLFREKGGIEAHYTEVLELDLSMVEPSLAGPKRPQDRVLLRQAKPEFNQALQGMMAERAADAALRTAKVTFEAEQFELKDGAVVIAAITSCTNTSNPSVLIGAGLLAQRAVECGLSSKPWVKTSFAPGSLAVTSYLDQAGLSDPLEALGFYLVGYGCTTCIGNSGPLPEPISKAIQEQDLIVASVLSGNRNFEGRIHPEVQMNYLASPPLVVAYAIAGTMDIDLYNDPLGTGKDGTPVYLRDIWPESSEIQSIVQRTINSEMFTKAYDSVFSGDALWQSLQVPASETYAWNPDSTYIRKPAFFSDITRVPEEIKPIVNAKVLALLGDTVTTDHISPAGAIGVDTPAARYLISHGIQQKDFNTYGSRRGNHEVMVRGTFANIRLRNQLAPGTEGGLTTHQPSGEQMSIYDAAMRYQEEGTPLLVLTGEEYGTGSSRDWAAKGTRLLGVRAVIARSFERIHRSNLVGMGVLPLQFKAGESVESLGLGGKDSYTLGEIHKGMQELCVIAVPEQGEPIHFSVTVRIDTPKEWDYFLNGGILNYVLRQLVN
ncbi:Aconitate hydratase [hydrothermal vent metagenome]|uniref:(2R,3S)-2-methylisocitrate dehydratase n=1 Tax=hydrothermal vent metagenome TaxID=652676 RepID=A0A3B1BF41_9ZZZZ